MLYQPGCRWPQRRPSRRTNPMAHGQPGASASSGVSSTSASCLLKSGEPWRLPAAGCAVCSTRRGSGQGAGVRFTTTSITGTCSSPSVRRGRSISASSPAPFFYDPGATWCQVMYQGDVSIRQELLDGYLSIRPDADLVRLDVEAFVCAAALSNLAFQIAIPSQRASPGFARRAGIRGGLLPQPRRQRTLRIRIAIVRRRSRATRSFTSIWAPTTPSWPRDRSVWSTCGTAALVPRALTSWPSL